MSGAAGLAGPGIGSQSESPPGLTVELADVSAAARWSEFVQRTDGAELYHDYRWRSVIENVFGHESHYLMANDVAGNVRGVLPLVRLKSCLFGDFLVSLPYFNYGGALVDGPAALAALLAEAERLARARGSEHVELRHRSGFEIALPSRDDKVTMLLDLPESEQLLWSRFKAKLRSQIRRPEKEGCDVREGGAELLEDFYSVFARNMRDLGTPVYPRSFFAEIVALFPAEARAFVVYRHGKPLAAGLLLAHRSTLQIPWASSLREANSVGVNMLLYWSVLRYAIARGCRQFDFGRSTKDSGTYRFKQQWGARPQQLRWFYLLQDSKPLPLLSPNNPKYRAAIALWRKLPLPIANLLGPHVVKNLP